ncbi:MAG: hypothetical protein ACYCTW_09530 [Sulfuricella sp.]
MGHISPVGYLPLHDLVRLLRTKVHRHRPWLTVVSEHLVEVRDSRIDLRLLVSLSPRPSLRCCPGGIGLTDLVPRLVDHLKRDDLSLPLLRTLSLIALTRDAETIRSMPFELVSSLLYEMERGEDLLKAGTPDDKVVALVCLPYARLALRHSAEARVELTTLIQLLNNIKQVDGLICADEREYELPSGSLRYQRDKQKPGLSFLAGDRLLHTLAVLCSVQGILSYFLAQNLYVDQEYSPVAVSKALKQARNLQGRCWRAFRTLRRHFSHLYRDLAYDLEFIRLEANALAQLAQFERVCRRHPLAVRLSIGAIAKLESVSGLSGAPAEASRFRSLLPYLKQQGIKDCQLQMPQGSPRLDEGEPCLALLAASEEPMINNAIVVLSKNGNAPAGWGVKACDDVRKNVYEPTVRAEAFKLALRIGALDVARSFFHLSGFEERGEPNAESIKGCRTAMARQLGKEGVFAYANGVGAVSQSGVQWLAEDVQNRLKAGLRKMLRELANIGGLSSLRVKEHLFLNHVQIGLGYHARRVHRGQYAAIVDAKDASTEVIDKMLEATDRGRLRSVSLHSFWDSTFKISDDEVMVSLMTDDGGTLKLTILASGRCIQNLPEAGAITQDWNQLLKEFTAKAQSQIKVYSDHPELENMINIPIELERLCMRILKVALDMNADTRRIMIHADPMWNVVPWQFILHMQLKDEFGTLVEKLIRQKKRKECNRGFGKVVFWRVPGVQLPPSVNAPSALAERQIKIDVSEPTFWGIKQQLISGRNGRPGDGLLSIIAHGRIDGGKHASFEVDGETVNGATMAKYGEYPLVLLHVCHAAKVDKLNIADDTMGVPGEIIQGGARVVVAPGLPLPTNLIEKIEQYFYDLERGDNLQDIEQRYLLSCVEIPEVGMYTLYSGAIAPLLEQHVRSE